MKPALKVVRRASQGRPPLPIDSPCVKSKSSKINWLAGSLVFSECKGCKPAKPFFASGRSHTETRRWQELLFDRERPDRE